MIELIRKINAGKWLVSSLYQSTPLRWHAALRPFDDFSTAYGEGATAEIALEQAWAQRGRRMREADWQRIKDVAKPIVRKRLTPEPTTKGRKR